jgi:hypothetical protein
MECSFLETGVDSDRLCRAADMLLTAMRSPRGHDTLVLMHVGSVFRGVVPSRDFFTSDECVEAMAMLIRLGLVPEDGSAW